MSDNKELLEKIEELENTLNVIGIDLALISGAKTLDQAVSIADSVLLENYDINTENEGT